MKTSLEEIQNVISFLHKCECDHVSTDHVDASNNGRSDWHGEVEVFRLIDHTRADKVFAWAEEDRDGEPLYSLVLSSEIVHTPEDAVRISMEQEAPSPWNAKRVGAA